MPDRILRASILTSDRLASLRNWESEVFYRRLFSVADDYGRYDARPAVLRAHLYPLQIDKMSETGIARCLRECERVRLVRLYSVEERPYLEIEDFGQRVQSKPKWPGPGEGEWGRTAVHGGLPFHSEAKSDSDSLFVGDVARGAGRRGEAGSAAPDEAGFRRFVAEVCALRPSWKKLRRLPMACEEAARDAAAALDLSSGDFALLGAYFASSMAKDRFGAAFWRPTGLEQFFRSMADVLSHAYRWRKESGWGFPKSAAAEQPVFTDGGQAATLESFRRFLDEEHDSNHISNQ
ncbi:hypothetical protein ICN84_11425 [Akkermansia glycaniphila]|uniref:hypothetical protein n=1 Tax=Akkermansia glycaniphila TaxID=1679444 RepID=UPI001C0233BF|nr:hypothetical protein [Akkermansia glycaniphila]MBT9450677.1 hypothetical protein [Akkermansia glycaniphila]